MLRSGTLNKKLIESERELTNADGLPRRPWYKHLLYAPGVYYGIRRENRAGSYEKESSRNDTRKRIRRLCESRKRWRTSRR